MIVGYIVCFVLGVIAFFLMAKFGLPMRLVVALAVFLIPSVILTVWVVQVGDKPPPDAVTIVPKDGGNDKESQTGQARNKK